MFCSPDKFIFAYLWLFALLTIGWTQDVLKTSQTKPVHVSTSRSPFLVATASPMPTVMPVYIRHRRASSNEMTSSCLAPPQPVNGQYKVDRYFCEDNSADCNISEGTSMEPGSQLVYSCNTGFIAKGNPDVYCSRGKWSTIPSCIEVKCASLNSASTTVSCTRFGKWVSCDSPVPPETRAEVTCRRGYKKDTDFISTRRGVVNCNINGKWEPDPIRCVPVCGVAITHQQPLVHGGVTAKIGDFPWHASLFVQKNLPSGSEKVFLCGATIIQSNLVLTAAHCVYDESRQATEDPAKLFLITGNIFRDYDSKQHNPDIVRKATVKNVYTYCNYYGLRGNYASDIALLELQHPFEFSSILLPACLDDSGYGEQFLESGVYGRVAGFGRTETGTTSGILQTITVPYISYSQCRDSSNGADTVPFISSDKFCAGYNNGSAVCEGDSGGGLVFRKGNLWHVMGIVSVGLGVDIHSGEITCDKYSYSLYTKVSTYMTWIQDVLFYVERNEQYPPCSRDSSPSMVTSTTPIPEVTSQSVTTPSIATAVTNWWDKLTSPAPHVTTPNVAVSSCPAPPQPPNGERKLYKDFCKADMNCNISEGTASNPGTQLVYKCDPGFEAEGTTNVYCHASGKWSSIPSCTRSNETACECVTYYRCSDGNAVQTDGVALLDIRFESRCPGTLDICCPKSAIRS